METVMKIQVLVSTMNQIDYSLANKMNIQTDAIIVNQCNENEITELTVDNNKLKFMSFNERGVGLSRNTALMRATADICLIADDDMRYVDGYNDIVLNAFLNNPKADMIVFNVPSTNEKRPTYKIIGNYRVRWYNSLRYGAVKIAVKTEKIRKANIYFSLLFGGGAKYSSGEDSLFVAECLRKGLKVYANPEIIGYVSQQESSWFEGYSDKYFIDKGVFFAHLNKSLAKLLCLQDLIRHYNLYLKDKTIIEAFKLMNKGIKIVKES